MIFRPILAITVAVSAFDVRAFASTQAQGPSNKTSDTLDPMLLEGGMQESAQADLQIEVGDQREVPAFSANGAPLANLIPGSELTLSAKTAELLKSYRQGAVMLSEMKDAVPAGENGLVEAIVWTEQAGYHSGDKVYIDLASLIRDEEVELASVETDSSELMAYLSFAGPDTEQVQATVRRHRASRRRLPISRHRVAVRAQVTAPSRTNLSPITAGALTSSAVASYSNSKTVLATIRYGLTHSAGRSIKRCWGYVKNALVAGHLTSHRLNSGAAINAMSELPANGFTNLLKDPAWNARIRGPIDAPIGSVLIYRGGCTHSWGHSEIRTSQGYFSDYVSYRTVVPPTGRVGKCHTLVGVFVKI